MFQTAFWSLPLWLRITLGLAWFGFKWGAIVGIASIGLNALFGAWALPVVVMVVVLAHVLRD